MVGAVRRAVGIARPAECGIAFGQQPERRPEARRLHRDPFENLPRLLGMAASQRDARQTERRVGGNRRVGGVRRRLGGARRLRRRDRTVPRLLRAIVVPFLELGVAEPQPRRTELGGELEHASQAGGERGPAATFTLQERSIVDPAPLRRIQLREPHVTAVGLLVEQVGVIGEAEGRDPSRARPDPAARRRVSPAGGRRLTPAVPVSSGRAGSRAAAIARRVQIAPPYAIAATTTAAAALSSQGRREPPRGGRTPPRRGGRASPPRRRPLPSALCTLPCCTSALRPLALGPLPLHDHRCPSITAGDSSRR